MARRRRRVYFGGVIKLPALGTAGRLVGTPSVLGSAGAAPESSPTKPSGVIGGF